MRLRSVLYRSASLLGDAEAVASGDPRRIARRAARKIVTRRTFGVLARLFR